MMHSMDNQHTRVLLIAAGAENARVIERLLAQSGVNAVLTHTDSLSQGLELLPTAQPGVIMLADSDTASLASLHSAAPDIPIIVIGASADDNAADQALRAGALDYLDPAHLDRLNLRRALRFAQEHRQLDVSERQLHELQLVHTLDKAIDGSLDMQLKLGIVLEQVINLLGIDAADILLFDPHKRSFHYAVGRGFRSAALKYSSVSLTEPLAQRAAADRRLYRIANLHDAADQNVVKSDQVELAAAEGFHTYLGMPLMTKSQVHGVLGMFKRTGFEPDEVWTGFVETFARQAAGTIATTLFETSLKSYNEMRLSYVEGIEDLARILDLRNKELPGHSQRVADFTVRLGRAMGVSDADCLHMRQGALLHDIGKMGIPDDVLLKPGPLTAEEWSLVRMHPLYAYHMLASITYLQPALDIPYCHHEHWDGSGYPRGLAGEEIPLAARIFAVADVWDALCSDKPFRKAWSQRQAYQLILQESGANLDPDVVAAFVKTISSTVS